MQPDEKRERLRLTMKRRAEPFYTMWGMRWSNREWHEFTQRLVMAHFEEGIPDVDLRVLVRYFNREVLGRQYGKA